MKLKIMATGSSLIAIEEVYHSIVSLVGDICVVDKCMIKEIKNHDEADLFVCGITQIDFLVQIVPREKILLAEPRFTSEFLVRVARIPAYSEAYIFHSSLVRINLMMQGMRNLGINDIKFIPIAETMPHHEIVEKLQAAEYIIGINIFLQEMLGEGKLYHDYLRETVKIIGGDRVSSMETSCKVIQWVVETFQARLTDRVNDIKVKLHQSDADEKNLAFLHIVNDVDQVVSDSDKMMETLRKVVFKAFSNQISPDITLGNDRVWDDAGKQIASNLENIKSLGDELAGITERIANRKRKKDE